jgi:histone H3/H4
MAACIGPSEFISMPAVYKFLNRAPLSVCAMDEFGAFLKRINSRKASGFEAQIGATLRTAWGSSFKPMPSPEWAGKDMGTIYAPALSIYGVSTSREFYASLAGADVTNGVLNRFLQIETKVRPAERMPTIDPTVVPASILAGLKKIYVPRTNPASILHQETKVPDHKKLDITPEAEAIRKALVKDIQAMGDADKTLEPFLARTAENAIRIATILAIGRHSMTVNAADMAWARAFTMWATQRMAEGAGLYIADSDNQAMANDVKRALKGNGKVSRSVLIRALGHKYKAKELDGVLNLMIEAEEVTVERGAPTSKGGQPPRWYTLQT